MYSKKINQLATNLNPQSTDLLPIGDPTTGQLKTITYNQLVQSAGVPLSRTLTINGTTFDLSANRTWTVGTVTSVGLSMPSAFTVSNTPVTGSGTLTVTAAGTASQYVRGDGQLADFPQGVGGGGASVNYYLNGSVNQGTFGGSTYYEMNKNAIIGSGTNFTINADGYIASFLTDANDPNLLLIPAGNWNFELKFSASSGGGTPSFYLELYKYDGTTFTLIATSSSSPEIITGGTSIDTYYTPLAVPETVLLATDRLAIRVYVTHQSKTITLYTENNRLAEVITTFTTGLNSLNGLTKQVQYFATGTSGTDFNISSSTDTHTFNFPTASATNRGLLSTTDWSTFNSKENVLTFSSPLVRSTNTISIPAATTSVNGYLTSTNWTTFNNKQNAITLTTTGSSGPATFVSNTLNIPNYISINDGIESGGVVSYSGTGLVFNVSACVYYINGIRYTTSATTITLTTADATNPRIDVIAVNTSSAVVLITGTPSANPVEPQVDPATQIQLTNITVNAGSTTPSIPSELVYDENVETWTKTNNGFLSVNYANTVAPYTGTKSTLVIKGTSSGGGSLSFTSPSILNLTDYSVLKFAIKLNRALIGGELIGIGIFYGGTLLGNYVYLYGPGYNQPLYGFDYSSTSWQLISVNLSSIGATSGNFNRLGIFGFFNVVDDIEIGYDRIEFQKINNQLPTSGISIGDKINNATTGSVLFTGANGILQQDNTNFYWDDTNNRLGLGNNTPSFTLDVSGTGRVTGNLTASSLIKSGGTASQILAADGTVITAGTNITISGGTISGTDTNTNIYNNDGTLTGNRTVTMGSYTLSFEKDISVNGVKIGRGISSSFPEFNTVIGNGAYAANISGFANTSVGSGAMASSQYGSANSAFGAFALNLLNGTSAATQSNTGIGRAAMNKLVTGQSNTAVGTNIFDNLTSGDYNTGIGKQAWESLTSGSYNIIVGASTGSPSLGTTTGSYNTIIGSQITGLASTLNNNILIADGQGNIRFKDDNTSTIISRLAGTGSRMVVAGTNGELSTQAIPSGGTVTSVGLTSATSGVTIGSSPITTSGNISLTIATASGSQNGLLSSTDFTTFNNKQNAITLTTTGTSGAATLIGNTLNIPQYSGGGGMAIGGSITSATAGSVLFAGTSGVLQQDNANFFWDDANNRLGIGTASPSNDITLSKNQNASTNILVSNTTSGTASQIQLILNSDATAGSGNLSKKSNTFTTSGIINLADLVLQNSTKGDIAILNSFASGTIKFAAGASSTAQVTIGTTGLTTFATGVDYKRLNPTTTTTASTATLTPDISAGDQFTITAQAAALSVANPTGTPVNGQKMIIRIKDNGTARAITWSGTQYRASSDLALPTTTIVNKTMYLGFIWNSTDSKWDLLAFLNNF